MPQARVLRRLPHRQGHDAQRARPSRSSRRTTRTRSWQSAARQALPGRARDRAAPVTTARRASAATRPPVPHPPNWIENHRPPVGTPPGDCNICHRDRAKCQECHHGSVKNGELVQRSCARGPGMKGCHVEMKQKPATAIKNKGFAEHAVHFDVKKSKGKPYQCYECHMDFGSSASAQKIEAQQGHDLQAVLQLSRGARPVQRPDRTVQGIVAVFPLPHEPELLEFLWRSRPQR